MGNQFEHTGGIDDTFFQKGIVVGKIEIPAEQIIIDNEFAQLLFHLPITSA
ncbi:hypothetical protein D3C83_78310 [compost metagenome]